MKLPIYIKLVIFIANLSKKILKEEYYCKVPSIIEIFRVDTSGILEEKKVLNYMS